MFVALQVISLFDFVVVFVNRQPEDLSRETKSSTDVNHNASTAVMTQSSHGPAKTTAQAVTSSSPATSSNSVLSNFLYGMPMSSKPHPDGKLDFKPMSLLNLGKDRLANWTPGSEKSTSVKDSANTGKLTYNMCKGGFQQWNRGEVSCYVRVSGLIVYPARGDVLLAVPASWKQQLETVLASNLLNTAVFWSLHH